MKSKTLLFTFNTIIMKTSFYCFQISTFKFFLYKMNTFFYLNTFLQFSFVFYRINIPLIFKINRNEKIFFN